MPNDENSKENSNANAFCVPAGYAKSEYFLDTQDLRSLNYEQKVGRYYGGLFKLYQPAALQALAEKKYGKNGMNYKRDAKVANFQRKEERDRKKQLEYQDRQQKEAERPVDAASCAGELYRRHHRPAFRREHRFKSHRDVDKMINAQYRSLPFEERRRWMDRSTADKARYNRELKTFNQKWKVGRTSRSLPKKHRPAVQKERPRKGQKAIDKMIDHSFAVSLAS